MKRHVFSSAFATSHADFSHGCRPWRMLLLSFLVVGLSGSLRATDFEKANNSTPALNLAGAYNTAGGPPGTSDRILVDSVMVANQSAALGGNLSIAGIFVDSTATKQLTITGSNTLTLGASGISIASGSTGNLIFNGPAITLGANQTWDFGTRGAQFTGSTTLSQNSKTLAITTTGTLTFTNTTAMSLDATISGAAGALTISGATLTLTNTNSTFNGASQITAGGTLSGSTLSTAAGSGSSTLGSGQLQVKGGTLKYTGNTATSGQNVAFDPRNTTNTVEVTTAGETLTLSNVTNMNLANASLLANGLNLGGVGNLIITTKAIADSSNGQKTATALTKFGVGTLTLSFANTYTGATTVSAGTLILSGTGSINTTSGTSVAASATLTNNSSAAYNKSLALTEGAVINGSGSFTPTAMTITADLTGQAFTTFALGSASLTKAGGLELTLSGITDGDYTLFSGGTITGAFTAMKIGGYSLTSGGGGNFSGTVLGKDYTFTNSTNLLSVVPEPATWALLAFSLTTVAVMRRRRKR